VNCVSIGLPACLAVLELWVVHKLHLQSFWLTSKLLLPWVDFQDRDMSCFLTIEPTQRVKKY
jgi:hypothetical protein